MKRIVSIILATALLFLSLASAGAETIELQGITITPPASWNATKSKENMVLFITDEGIIEISIELFSMYVTEEYLDMMSKMQTSSLFMEAYYEGLKATLSSQTGIDNFRTETINEQVVLIGSTEALGGVGMLIMMYADGMITIATMAENPEELCKTALSYIHP